MQHFGQQHAIARSRGYSHALTERLHALITRAHHQLYQRRTQWLSRLLHFIGGRVLLALSDKNGRLMALAAALFFGPAIVCGRDQCLHTRTWQTCSWAQRLVPGLEQMYQPGAALRPEGFPNLQGIFHMFGFYIFNNIGIDFPGFLPVAYCLASAACFSLCSTASMIGAAAGYLTGIGYGENFWGFVARSQCTGVDCAVHQRRRRVDAGSRIDQSGRQTRRLALLP